MNCTYVPSRRLRMPLLRAFPLGVLALLAGILASPPRPASAAPPTPCVIEPPDAVAVPGELLVQFRSTTPQGDRARIAREERSQIDRAITPDGLVTVRLDPSDRVGQAMARFRTRPEVEYAVPNLRARADYIPNDSLINDPNFDWAWNLRIVHAYEAYDLQVGDPSVVVGILDTGVAYEDRDVPEYEKPFLWPGTIHYKRSPELPGPFLPGWDFVHDDAYADDDNNHGTSVATIVAGQPNNITGSAGIACGVTIMPIKVIDWQKDSRMSWIVAGIRFAADHGVRILNMSLGFQPMSHFEFLGCTPKDINEYFRPLREAVNYAQQHGVIMVGSAGNSGEGEVSLPAGYPPVIAVGATGPDGIRTDYSAFGKNLDLMAPGGQFTQRTEDVLFVWSIKPNRSEGSLAKPDSFGVYPFVGTSAAAPHVTGAAALLMSRGVKSQGAIEQALEATAVRPPGSLPGRDLEYGAGLIQIDAALQNARGVGTKGTAAPAVTIAVPTRLLTRNPAGEAALAYRVGHAGRVRVRVFDVRGALVRALEERDATAGERTVRWDGRDGSGAPVATGLYLVRVETPDGIATRKVAILR